MTDNAENIETIEDFFARYTQALSEVDLDALAEIYHYPALAVSGFGCLAITEPQQTRDFFEQNAGRYRDSGITAVRARDVLADAEAPGLWIGHLVLENLDTDNSVVGTERNAYQVVTTDGHRHIAVTTPLDSFGQASDRGDG